MIKYHLCGTHKDTHILGQFLWHFWRPPAFYLCLILPACLFACIAIPILSAVPDSHCASFFWLFPQYYSDGVKLKHSSIICCCTLPLFSIKLTHTHTQIHTCIVMQLLPSPLFHLSVLCCAWFIYFPMVRQAHSCSQILMPLPDRHRRQLTWEINSKCFGQWEQKHYVATEVHMATQTLYHIPKND